ncbi:MAG: NUDIX domain-containing protein [Nanoarchaeota archaeon]|nr:NUDIX domain-containing protein [Nanoarchaeota archaeon]
MEFNIDWKGQKYLMEWLDDVDFESLENVVQAYGFIFDKNGKLCIINCTGNWCLPGGTIEDYDNNFEDTLIREVNEEADLDIENIKRVGCFKCTSLSDNCERKGVHHILRYVADVDNIKEQTEDPAIGKIPERKFIDTEDFLKFVPWGDSGAFQLKKALEVLNGKERI